MTLTKTPVCDFGIKAKDFKLKSINNELVSLNNVKGEKATLIMFICNHCPYVKAIIKDLVNDCKELKKEGVKFFTSHGVKAVERNGNEVTVKATNKKGDEVVFKGDYCLVSVGRSAYTAGLELENVGIKVNERGQIAINDHLQTNVSNIYAIGDVVKGMMLAHKAEEEGVVVAEMIAGQKPHIDYNLIPGIVYTWPEVGAVGKTEQELKEAGVDYKVGKFSMRALGRSRASGDLDGFVKVLAAKETDEVLGVHIVGARAADLIMEAAVAMEYRASAEDLARICHGHPTYSEAIKEAAKGAWDGKPLNA